MKIIGVVAICVGGTTQFLSHIAQYSLSVYNGKTPELLLHQSPLEKYLRASRNNDGLILQQLLLESILKLQDMGADFAVIPNNTAHCVIQQVIEKSPIPILNLLDVVAKQCQKKALSNILLLGTSTLIESAAFQQALKAQGFEVGQLTSEENQQLSEEIMGATNSGDTSFSFSDQVDKTIRSTATHYSATLLACSDLVSAYHNQLDTLTIDPIELLAQEAVKTAMLDLSL